jgi:hypothetical protein
MVGIQHHQAVSRRRARDSRIRRGIEEVGQSMSIVQIAGQAAAATSIRRLHTSRVSGGVRRGKVHDRRDPREEEVCGVFMLL